MLKFFKEIWEETIFKQVWNEDLEIYEKGGLRTEFMWIVVLAFIVLILWISTIL